MQTLSAHMLKILNHLHVAKSCDDVHQGADATLLCELCLEKGLQADSISSAVSHSGAPMSQQQQHAVAGQKGSVSALSQDGSATRQPDGRQRCRDSCREDLHCESTMSTNYSTAGGQASHCPSAAHAEPASQEQHAAGQARRLRILCLHGFRQSASSLKGRTAALARKLADLAELVYIDAPHPLPFVVKDSRTSKVSDCARHPERRPQDCDAMNEGRRDREESARPQHHRDVCDRELEADDSNSRWEPEACKSSPSTAAHEGSASAVQHCANGHTKDVLTEPSVADSASGQPQPPPKRHRRAWLLEPEQVPVSQVSLMQV